MKSRLGCLYRWFLVAPTLVLLCFTSAVGAQALPTGTARGAIVIDGKATELRHAYALATTSLSERKPETILILADKALSSKALTDTFARMSEARENDVKRLEFTLDEKQVITSLQFAIEPLSGGGFSSSWRLALDKAGGKPTWSGRVSTEGELKLFDNRYQFDVQFNAAPVAERKPAVSGAAAWATPQGKAVAAYLRAARAGDKAAIKRAVGPEAGAVLDTPEGAQILEFLKESPDPAKADFDGLFIDGDSAEARLTERTREGASSSTIRLRRVGGQWMVSPRG